MKRITFMLIAIMAMLITSCSKDDDLKKSNSNNDISSGVVGKWKLVSKVVDGSSQTINPNEYLEIKSDSIYIDYDGEDYNVGYWKKSDNKLELINDDKLTSTLYPNQEEYIIFLPLSYTITKLDTKNMVLKISILGFDGVLTYERQTTPTEKPTEKPTELTADKIEANLFGQWLAVADYDNTGKNVFKPNEYYSDSLYYNYDVNDKGCDFAYIFGHDEEANINTIESTSIFFQENIFGNLEMSFMYKFNKEDKTLIMGESTGGYLFPTETVAIKILSFVDKGTYFEMKLEFKKKYCAIEVNKYSDPKKEYFENGYTIFRKAK